MAEMNRSPRMTVTLGIEELMLVTTMATDQLFRGEFIDPRMPGIRAVALSSKKDGEEKHNAVYSQWVHAGHGIPCVRV